MAKKSSAKKTGSSKRAPAKRSAKKAAPPKSAAKAGGARKRPLKQDTLPGMEQVRDRVLDRYCESIGDTRDQMNRLRSDEAADTSGALRRMQEKGTSHYIHAGVELVRVPGSDKLRVRRTSAEDAQEGPTVDEGGDSPDADDPLAGEGEAGVGAEG